LVVYHFKNKIIDHYKASTKLTDIVDANSAYDGFNENGIGQKLHQGLGC
jgi:hypothetical protein